VLEEIYKITKVDNGYIVESLAYTYIPRRVVFKTFSEVVKYLIEAFDEKNLQVLSGEAQAK